METSINVLTLSVILFIVRRGFLRSAPTGRVIVVENREMSLPPHKLPVQLPSSYALLTLHRD